MGAELCSPQECLRELLKNGGFSFFLWNDFCLHLNWDVFRSYHFDPFPTNPYIPHPSILPSIHPPIHPSIHPQRLSPWSKFSWVPLSLLLDWTSTLAYISPACPHTKKREKTPTWLLVAYSLVPKMTQSPLSSCLENLKASKIYPLL